MLSCSYRNVIGGRLPSHQTRPKPALITALILNQGRDFIGLLAPTVTVGLYLVQHLTQQLGASQGLLLSNAKEEQM